MKKVSRPQYYRIRRILGMIREGSRTGHLPNASDFCSDLEVSRPTAMRDLDFLRDEENAPIEYVSSRHGYRLSDKTWSLPPVQLSRKEVFAFSIAKKLIERFRGTSLELDMQSVLDKIAESIEGDMTMDLETMTEHCTVLSEDYVVQDPATWAEVARCVDRREAMKVVYQKFNGEVKDYTLEPYHLLSYHGNWYVLAKPAGKDHVATFAVSRIRKIAGEGEFFDMPVGFNVKEHIDKAFGIVRGDKVFRVRLLFSAKVATYIKERVWHAEQRIVEKRNGSIELSFETAGWKELVRWILSWQPDVKVLAPKRLRERIETKMREALGVRGEEGNF